MNEKELIDKELRGKATIFKDGNVTFTPQGKGDPRHEQIVTAGQSTVYKVKGKQKETYVAHLKCNAEDPDPRASLYEQLDRIAAKAFPAADSTPPPRGKLLLQQEGLQVVSNGKRGLLSIQLTIDLQKHVDYMKQFYKLINETNQCLAINETSLRQLCRALAKYSSKSPATPPSPKS